MSERLAHEPRDVSMESYEAALAWNKRQERHIERLVAERDQLRERMDARLRDFKRVQAERDQLRTALENPTWDEMIARLERWLDRHYPVALMQAIADDPGPEFTLALHDALETLHDRTPSEDSTP